MRRLVDWIGGALSGVLAYRLWKRWQEPEAVTAPADVEPDERAEELRAKLAETRAASEDPAGEETAGQPEESAEPLEERRRRVHEEGRAAIDRMNDN